MKKALVTGATGYLGRALVPELEKIMQCDTINTLNCDLRQWKDIAEFHFNHEYPKYDYIFHLAAQTKAGDYCLTHQGDQWLNNQLINTNVLKYWKEFQPKAKMIAIGTSCMYDPQKLPTEKNILKGQPEKSLYSYAMAKRMLLIGLKAFEQQYNMKYVMLVPSTIYGPGFDKNDSHFIFDLINKIYNYKKYGVQAILWGDGEQVRDVIYIDDLIKFILWNFDSDYSLELNKPKCNERVYNISSSDHTIKQYAEFICNILAVNYEDAITYDKTKYIGAKEKYILSQFEDLTIDIKTGLTRTINYYLNTYTDDRDTKPISFSDDPY